MGIGDGSCWGVFCAAGVVCVGAYQTPWDVDTKVCYYSVFLLEV
jgi:hypothetical protein